MSLSFKTAVGNVVEGALTYPFVKLAQLKFTLQATKDCPDLAAAQEQAVTELFELIKKHDMAPFYEAICASGLWPKPLDATLLAQLKESNTAALARFDAELETAKESAGPSEVQAANQKIAEYKAFIGAPDAAAALETVLESTVGAGPRLDNVLLLARFAFSLADNALIGKYIDRAKKLIDAGGDWDRRNRLKVYEGTYLMSIRDFTRASELFLSALPTFTSTELLQYDTFISYSILMCLFTLDREMLKSKILDSPEVLEVAIKVAPFLNLAESFYNCEYRAFFTHLAEVEALLKKDLFLFPHYKYYVREMRIRAYAQYLEPYKSVKLQSMADTFGVSPTFIDEELSRFISAGRIHCAIDAVSATIATRRPDNRNSHYRSIVQEGDLLLNRIQKLARVTDL
ncbi:hypothetical protein H696_04009 [Fonticula alba]|uniref:PCI domain-containing protein n=1 Tax=Fonticula alba TaxID=691883 RepID=A0A058Z6P4_FONAL|nr:hypothetical protein H696_04009 [Fonticula alba]KCV69588.1 hypothetical protein H696_04009 [Fonticula alba]|eukprot:XP_009496153.1 hypothetical protein H696_04009 [Fonticula alba]